MSFLSSLFFSPLTPVQHCFPYFFDEKLFKRQLEKIGLQYRLSINKKNELFDPLLVFDDSGFNIQIEYFTYLMFDQFDNMIMWRTIEDIIYITKISVKSGCINKGDYTIDVTNLKPGKSQLEEDFGLSNFVTYVRKKDIKYELAYFENYAIVIINKNFINLLPFDWFNKSGGDYGYVWPATARLNLETNELMGKGMRMADFKIQL